jgi:hypothetical protein
MAGKTPDPIVSTSNEETSMRDLITAVEALRCEVQVLREVLDAIRDDFAWALKNRAFRCDGMPPAFHLTSMPADPLAADFGERINRLKPEDVPPEQEPPPTTSGGSTQREFWS